MSRTQQWRGVVEEYRELLDSDDDYVVAHYITRGPARGSPTVVILCEPIDWRAFAHQYGPGAHAVTSSVRAVPSQVWDPKIKSTSRLHLWQDGTAPESSDVGRGSASG